MQLKWTKRALAQFNQAQEYIAQEDPQAAQAVAQRIADALQLLLTQPHMGRVGRAVGTQEWVVVKTPYLIAYRVKGNDLTVLRVLHSKRRWPVRIR